MDNLDAWYRCQHEALLMAIEETIKELITPFAIEKSIDEAAILPPEKTIQSTLHIKTTPYILDLAPPPNKKEGADPYPLTFSSIAGYKLVPPYEILP